MSTKTPQSGTRFSQKPLKKRPSATPKKIRVKYKEELTKKMAHMVFCTKYKAEMEGLDEPPFDSDFGQKIYKNVSKKAWGEWIERQKMLLNEYRLQPWTREAQEFLVEQMNEFFFGEGGTLPKEYVAPTH
jgi:Fe-S cluster biosynthesis and repair protein YggX